MKRNSLRRLGALVLSLALTLSLAPPAWAAGPSIEINPTTLTLAPGETSANVTATLKDGGRGSCGDQLCVERTNRQRHNLRKC